jgi:two-component system response regulator HydG
LCEHFLKDFSQTHERPMPTISPSVSRILRAYDWPGNVRELRNTLESMYVVDADGRLDLDDLPDELQGHPETGRGGTQESLIGKPLEEVEAYYIEQTLKMTEGNREETANLLKIGARTLYRKIKEYNIPTYKSDRRRKSSGSRKVHVAES